MLPGHEDHEPPATASGGIELVVYIVFCLLLLMLHEVDIKVARIGVGGLIYLVCLYNKISILSAKRECGRGRPICGEVSSWRGRNESFNCFA